MSGFPAAVRRIIEQRSGGTCEGCGEATATEMHHCQYRSRGGPDVASNALHLCGRGNESGCHGRAHDGIKAEGIGWSIRSRHNPLLVPALVFIGGVQQWVRFDDEGDHEVVNQYDAIEYLHLIGARKAG